MELSTLGLAAKRRVGNPGKDRFNAACDLAYRNQPKVFATHALRYLGTGGHARHRCRYRRVWGWAKMETAPIRWSSEWEP